MKHLRRDHERQYAGFAALRADIHNSSQFIDHKRRVFAPRDFMPGDSQAKRVSFQQFVQMVKEGALCG